MIHDPSDSCSAVAKSKRLGNLTYLASPSPSVKYYNEERCGQWDDPDSDSYMKLIGTDLNDAASFERILEELTSFPKENNEDWYTIIVSEALFLYLEPDVPAKLLQSCQKQISREKLSFCFADRIMELPNKRTSDREDKDTV